MFEAWSGLAVMRLQACAVQPQRLLGGAVVICQVQTQGGMVAWTDAWPARHDETLPAACVSHPGSSNTTLMTATWPWVTRDHGSNASSIPSLLQLPLPHISMPEPEPEPEPGMAPRRPRF